MSQLPGRGTKVIGRRIVSFDAERQTIVFEGEVTPANIVRHIKGFPQEDRREVRMGTECQCHTHREHVPLHRHHVWPTGMGGPDEDGNIVSVCANAHYSIHAFLDHLVTTGGDPDPEVAKAYGWKVRRLARRGYDRWRANRP